MKLYQLTNSQPKSKMKASEGLSTGKYKFYTSSPIQSKYCEKAIYKSEALIFGTGGNPSVHYCNEPFSTSTDCLVLYGNNDKVNLELIYYYLFSNIHILENGFKGAGLKHISANYILNINIDLLNESVQNEILNKIKLIDKLISKKKEQLNKLDIAIKSRFVEMFGDPVNNTFGWEKFTLGNRCKIVTGNTPSRAKPENYGTYIEWIKSDNINTENTYILKAKEYLSEMGFQKCRFVDKGSLLMTCIAGSINSIGNVAITDRRVAFNQQINAIVPNQDEVLYIYWLMLLSKPIVQGAINMALKGILSKGQLSEMKFPFPPLEQQKQFAEFVEKTDKSKFEVQKSLEKLELLKKSLMQKYFG